MAGDCAPRAQARALKRHVDQYMIGLGAPFELPSPSRRRYAYRAFEDSREVRLVGEPAGQRNLADGGRGREEQALSECDPRSEDELGIGDSGRRLEGARQIAWAHFELLGDLVDPKSTREVAMDEGLDATHLPAREPAACDRMWGVNPL